MKNRKSSYSDISIRNGPPPPPPCVVRSSVGYGGPQRVEPLGSDLVAPRPVDLEARAEEEQIIPPVRRHVRIHPKVRMRRAELGGGRIEVRRPIPRGRVHVCVEEAAEVIAQFQLDAIGPVKAAGIDSEAEIG